MKVKSEFLRIYTGPSPDGQPVDPEGRPVQRVIQSGASVAMTGGAPITGPQKELNTQVVIEDSVINAANSQRWLCKSCAFFDRKRWHQLMNKWVLGTPDERQALQGLRASLLMTQNAELINEHQSEEGDLDVEHVLQAMGFCHALSQANGREIIVHPKACCPTDVQTVQSPQGYWRPRNKEATAQGTAQYDATMKTAAAGKNL